MLRVVLYIIPSTGQQQVEIEKIFINDNTPPAILAENESAPYSMVIPGRS